MKPKDGTEAASEMNAKISLGEKLSYAGGDAACNVVYGLTATLLTLFYTDYMGISPAVIGTIMLVSRIFDGGSDVIMGVITERTKSRYGKARPWILWTAVPYALSAVLLFLIPREASEMFKAVYIFVTYNLVTTVVYTALNLPYGALAAMMTRNQQERAIINVLRMAISPLGRILVTSLTLPLVGVFGNDQRAWIITTGLFSGIALVLLLLCFRNTRERVNIPAANKMKVPIKKSIWALFMNKHWLMCLGLWGVLAVYSTVIGIVLAYYCKYILGNQNYTGVIYTVEQGMMIVTITLLPLVLQKFTKRNLALAGAVLLIGGQLLVFINPSSYPLLVAAAAVKGIGEGPLYGVVFSLLADSVEYGQWKTHIRQEGMVFSAASVGSKLGAGLSSAAVGGILAAAGYISSETAIIQPASAIRAISNVYMYAPVLIWGVGILILCFYRLDKKYPAIMKELQQREAKGEL